MISEREHRRGGARTEEINNTREAGRGERMRERENKTEGNLLYAGEAKGEGLARNSTSIIVNKQLFFSL